MLSTCSFRSRASKSFQDATQLTNRAYSRNATSSLHYDQAKMPRKPSPSRSPKSRTAQDSSIEKRKAFPTRFALLNRPDVTQGHDRPSQRPYGVGTKIQKLFEDNKTEEAIKMVEGTPVSSQNVVVWALLIRQVLQEQRFNRAFELWQAMKKRGLRPTSRTFATFFSGCAKLTSATSKQMDRIRAIWSEFKRYESTAISDHKDGEPYPEHSSVSPYVPYIDLESRYGNGERLLDIFSSMASSGPFAPDKMVYTAMMNGLSKRKPMRGESEVATDREECFVRNAEDVGQIWASMVQRGATRRDEKLEVDSYALVALLRTLSKGSVAHQQYAIDVGTRYLGLDGQKDSLVELDTRSLNAILELCNKTAQYDLCIQHLKNVITSPSQRRQINKSSVDCALEAYAFLASIPTSTSSHTSSEESLKLLRWMLQEAYSSLGPKILPDRRTYNLCLLTSWRCKDWKSATDIFEIMTGLKMAHFDGAAEFQIKSSKPDKTRVDMDAQSMGYLLRLATEIKDPGYLHSSLRIFEYYGVPHFFPTTASPNDNHPSLRRQGTTDQPTEGHSNNYYQFTLANGLQGALVAHLGGNMSKDERERYKKLLMMCKSIKEKLKS